MKKFLLLAFLVLATTLSVSAQQARKIFTTTVVANDSRILETGSGVQYHELTWTVSGTVSTCQVALTSSVDGITFGGTIIAAQTCTSAGVSAVSAATVANYVRIEVSTFSGTGSVTVTYLGYTANPASAGPIGGLNGQIQYNNAGALAGIAGSSVTAATGAVELQATADNVLPFSVYAHSITQSQPIVDYNNNAAAFPSLGLVTYRGTGVGSFGPNNIPTLLFQQQDVNATGARVVATTFNGDTSLIFFDEFVGTTWYGEVANHLNNIADLQLDPTGGAVLEASVGGVTIKAGSVTPNVSLLPGTAGVVTVGSATATGSFNFVGKTSGAAALGVADAAGTAVRINLPLATGSSGQCLTTNGATPQQTSWASCTTGAVTSVTGTTNQITSSGGATPVLSIPNLFVPPSQLELGSSTIITTAPLEIHVGATEFAAAFYSHSGTSFFTPEFDFYRSRGTQASPTALVTSDQLQYQIWNGYDGTAYATGGLMLLQTLENWDATHHGAFIQFNTVIAGTANNVDMFDIGIGTGGHNVSRANLVALAGKCIGISSSAASTASDSTCIWRDGSDGIFAFGSATPNDKSGTLEAATVTATGVITANTAFVGPLVQSAVDSVASAPLAAITVRGGDITGGTGSLSAGGNVTLRSGNNAASNAASAAGNIDILPGLSTGATQGLQGLLLLSENYIKGGGTSTLWNLQCIVTTTAMTVNDCGASPTLSTVGVAFAVNSNTVQVNTVGSQTPVNASAAVTVGHTVCAGSTAGQVTDSGGTGPCGTGAGFTVGEVIAVAGTYVLPIAGSTTLSTTLPLIQLNRVQGAGVANNVAWSGVTSGANAQTGAFSTTAPWTFSAAGAASTPGLSITGTPFAGTGTTSFPQVYINDGSGAATTNWTTTGTMLGGTIPSGFAGDVQRWTSANTTIMRLTAGGALSLNIGGASFLVNGNVSTSGAAVVSGTYTTNTICKANGTSANPSVAACGSSAAGMFSCATAASTGTCQVNTSAVTANSSISITQNQADGGAGQLNVTCNTGFDLPAAAPILASKSAGASFTINLGTVTANPACFEYTITN